VATFGNGGLKKTREEPDEDRPMIGKPQKNSTIGAQQKTEIVEIKLDNGRSKFEKLEA